MVRGVNKCQIFNDATDNKRYLSLLLKYMRKYDVAMYAWCLMVNHVHLLPLAPSIDALACMMHDLGTSYSKYFNKRYDRVGHLIQGRFNSKPVDDEGYLLRVVRYIHRNPIGPHLSKTCDYRWSSYQEYIGKYEPLITTTTPVLNSFDGIADFERFHLEGDEVDGSLDPISCGNAIPWARACEIAYETLGEENLRTLKSASREVRREGIASLSNAGLSYAQIQNLTGINKGTISRLIKTDTCKA